MRGRVNFVAVANDIGASDKALELPEEHYLPALGLYMLALCYCDRQRTDGFITRTAARRAVAPGVDTEPMMHELIRAGFIDEADGGFQIVKYLDWQRSRAEIEQTIERNRKAGALGGKAKAAKNKDLTDKKDRPTDKRVLPQTLSESLSEMLSEVPDQAGEVFEEHIRDAARALSRRSANPVTPADVVATIAKAAPDAMPSEIRRAVDLVASDGSVRVPLSIFAIRLKEARAAREAF